MKFLLINSGDTNAFAAYSDDAGTNAVYAGDFTAVPEGSGKKPDMLIHCLNKLAKETDIKSVDAVSVTVGPGSFTGIRVGLALAKGLAFGLGKKIIPVNSFLLTLNRIPRVSENITYCILIQAKKPEYYYGLYTNGKIIRSGSDIIENITGFLNKDDVIVGDFDDESDVKHYYFKYINVKNLKNELDSMRELTFSAFSAGDLYNSDEIEPVYLKDFRIKKI